MTRFELLLVAVLVFRPKDGVHACCVSQENGVANQYRLRERTEWRDIRCNLIACAAWAMRACRLKLYIYTHHFPARSISYWHRVHRICTHNFEATLPFFSLRAELFRFLAVGWVGLGWVGLGWVGLGWVGLGWVGLGWVGSGGWLLGWLFGLLVLQVSGSWASV